MGSDSAVVASAYVSILVRSSGWLLVKRNFSTVTVPGMAGELVPVTMAWRSGPFGGCRPRRPSVGEPTAVG